MEARFRAMDAESAGMSKDGHHSPWSSKPVGAASELEYYQRLIPGMGSMFQGYMHEFPAGSAARFWLMNSKMRVLNLHLRRRRLEALRLKVEIAPKTEAELEDYLRLLDQVHGAIKDYDEALVMFETPYARAIAARSLPFKILDRFFKKDLPPIINVQTNTLHDTFRQVKAALDDLRYLDAYARFGVGIAGGASLVIPTIIMTFKTSSHARLITVSVCVILFAGFLATGTRARSPEILAASCAYAAVLIVYLGASK